MDSVGNVVEGGSNLVSHHNTVRPRRLPENREEKWSKQFWRSYSLPTSRRFSVVNDGDPSITFLDDTNIQIIIESDSVPRLVHESTPVEASSERSSRKQCLHSSALHDLWHPAEIIYDRFPDMVRIPLTASGDTALHVAVGAKSTTFVKELVTLMTPGDLEIPNVDGNTAFCIAAIAGNRDLFQIMMDKNENLPIIPGHDGMLPVHLAALTGYHEIVQDLSSYDLLRNMDFMAIQQLFFMTINSNMYDVATKLVRTYPEELVVARYDKDQLTALHMLARKPSEEFHSSARILLEVVGFEVRQLENNKILELITHPSIVSFDAVKSGNDAAAIFLLSVYRELLTIRDPKNGWNLLHFAVLYRQRDLIDFILRMWTVNLVIRAVDKDRNNVLHFAAHHQPEETSSSLRPHIQMKKELAWFEEMENKFPAELRTMRNSNGKTPKDIFYAQHMKLSNEVKESAKGIANSGIVVATLIATVAFAAALTVPGDKSSAAFIVFILTNAVALFTSSASIVSFSFLLIFTSSRFTESEFIVPLHPSLIFGLPFLFISIAAMVIAFAAASFLIFDHIYKWVAYVVASLGLLPILMFLGLQFNLLDGLLHYFFWPRYFHLSKVQ